MALLQTSLGSSQGSPDLLAVFKETTSRQGIGGMGHGKREGEEYSAPAHLNAGRCLCPLPCGEGTHTG
jgi:hypothetical protein